MNVIAMSTRASKGRPNSDEMHVYFSPNFAFSQTTKSSRAHTCEFSAKKYRMWPQFLLSGEAKWPSGILFG